MYDNTCETLPPIWSPYGIMMILLLVVSLNYIFYCCQQYHYGTMVAWPHIYQDFTSILA